MAQRRLRQQRHRGTGRRAPGRDVDVVLRLDQADGVGGHGHGADRLLVALVAHIENGVALAGADLELVVDLGHERAHGVDHHAAGPAGVGDDLGSRAVGREHERRAGGDIVHVVDEDHPLGPELVDDVTVVDDLVVAVDRRLEDPDHPRQGLDRLLHTGAESPRARPAGHVRPAPSQATGPVASSRPGAAGR